MPSQTLRVLVVAAALGTATACASRGEPFAPRVTMESCVQAALAQKPGRVIEVEGETGRNGPVYEVDIAGDDGRRWEIKCDGINGKILSVAEESGDAKAAAISPKITEAQARKAALAARPGEIVEMEYEVESDGRAVYEFDIRAADGTVWEVEVDAMTGNVLGSKREGWFRIGRD